MKTHTPLFVFLIMLSIALYCVSVHHDTFKGKRLAIDIDPGVISTYEDYPSGKLCAEALRNMLIDFACDKSGPPDTWVCSGQVGKNNVIDNTIVSKVRPSVRVRCE